MRFLQLGIFLRAYLRYTVTANKIFLHKLYQQTKKRKHNTHLASLLVPSAG